MPGGSALNGTIRAMMAAFNTNTAASTGAIGWVCVDYIRHGQKFSLLGACGTSTGLNFCVCEISNQMFSPLTEIMMASSIECKQTALTL